MTLDSTYVYQALPIDPIDTGDTGTLKRGYKWQIPNMTSIVKIYSPQGSPHVIGPSPPIPTAAPEKPLWVKYLD